MLPLCFLLVYAFINVSVSFNTTDVNISLLTNESTTQESPLNFSTNGDDANETSVVQKELGDIWEDLSLPISVQDYAQHTTPSIDLLNGTATNDSSKVFLPAATQSKKSGVKDFKASLSSQQWRNRHIMEPMILPISTNLGGKATEDMRQYAQIERRPSREEIMKRWNFLRRDQHLPATQPPSYDTIPPVASMVTIRPHVTEKPNISGGLKKTITSESGHVEMWNVRYIRKDDSEVEHYLVNKNVTWKEARRFCKKMKMRLAKFEDDDEPGFVAQSLHQKCPYCTLAWIRGVNDRRDGYTCKLVHLEDDEAGMIRCSKRNKLAKKRTFLCTKRISNTARGIEIKAERSKKRSITQIFFAKPATLEDAHKNCNRRGYRLGVFHDIPEAAHVMKSYLKKCSGCGGLYWISTPPWTSYEESAEEMRDEGASKLADDDDLYHITKKICKKANFSSSTRKSFSAKKEKEIAELLRKAYWASSHTYHVGRSGEFCDTLSVGSLKFVPLECDEEPDKRRKNSPKGYVCTKVEE